MLNFQHLDHLDLQERTILLHTHQLHVLHTIQHALNVLLDLPDHLAEMENQGQLAQMVNQGLLEPQEKMDHQGQLDLLETLGRQDPLGPLGLPDHPAEMDKEDKENQDRKDLRDQLEHREPQGQMEKEDRMESQDQLVLLVQPANKDLQVPVVRMDHLVALVFQETMPLIAHAHHAQQFSSVDSLSKFSDKLYHSMFKRAKQE